MGAHPLGAFMGAQSIQVRNNVKLDVRAGRVI